MTDAPPGRWRGLWDVVRRVQRETKVDNLTLVAAGVAFYAMLALFPAIIAMVTVYALAADPDQVDDQLAPLLRGAPPDARRLILQQVENTVAADNGGLTVGLVASLAGTVWASSRGMRAQITGLNVINGVQETRNVIRIRLLALGLTFGALVATAVSLGLVAAFPVVLRRLGLGLLAAVGAQVVRWLVLIVVVQCGLAVLYRFGPARADSRWRWVSWGTVVAMVVWVVVSLGFSLYVGAFGNYNKAYGALAGVIVLLLWLYLSALAILLGAEVDSVLAGGEKSVTGLPPEPTGTRDARQPKGVTA